MPRPTRPLLSRFALALGLALLVQGCQLSLPGGGGQSADVTPNAVTGAAIEVTALEPGPAATTAAPAPAAAVQPGAGTVSDAEPTAAAVEPPEPATQPVPEALPMPEPAAEVPEIEKSSAQLDCERRKGRWVPVGISGELRTCVFTTRDSGKQCTRSNQCEGACLARSGTCAPFRPLIGCHEVLQDNGIRATQCIE
jgi:hypothetical protein